MSSKPSAEHATIAFMFQPRARSFIHFPSIFCSIFVILSFFFLSFADTSATGPASWYGEDFAGNLTANGEIFDPSELTAAHLTLPFGTRVRVTNTNNGETVVVRINDRGPYIHGRIIDLSHAAADAIGMVRAGVAPVSLEILAEDGSVPDDAIVDNATLLAGESNEESDAIASLEYVEAALSVVDNDLNDEAINNNATTAEAIAVSPAVQEISYQAAETEQLAVTVTDTQSIESVPSIEASLVGMEQRDASLHMAQTLVNTTEETLEATAQLTARLSVEQETDTAYQQAIQNKLATMQAHVDVNISVANTEGNDVVDAANSVAVDTQSVDTIRTAEVANTGYSLHPVETVYDVRQAEPEATSQTLAPRVLRRMDKLSIQQATQEVLVAVEHLHTPTRQTAATHSSTITDDAIAGKNHAIQVVTWLGQLEVVCPEYPEGTTLHVRGTTSSEIMQVQVVKANVPIGSPMLTSAYLAAALGDSITVLN